MALRFRRVSFGRASFFESFFFIVFPLARQLFRVSEALRLRVAPDLRCVEPQHHAESRVGALNVTIECSETTHESGPHGLLRRGAPPAELRRGILGSVRARWLL